MAEWSTGEWGAALEGGVSRAQARIGKPPARSTSSAPSACGQPFESAVSVATPIPSLLGLHGLDLVSFIERVEAQSPPTELSSTVPSRPSGPDRTSGAKA